MQKIVLITGGSSDIGLAIANRLKEENYSIILTSRNKPEDLDESFTFIQADLTRELDIRNLIDNIERVDLLVNAAAIWHNNTEVFADKEYFDFRWEDISSTMQVGIIAPMMLIYLLKDKFEKDSNIINITGTFEDGGKGWVPYYVSKKALEELTYALSDDLRDRGIRVNAVCPSDTATKPYSKFFPQYMDEAISPNYIADVVIKMINEKRNGSVEVVKKDL
jgi:NAD(P)-dependent dehydrogenase (short-subunit alcohol dehydrogenase family)